VKFNIIVGDTQAVHISSDLFEAFGAWDAKEAGAGEEPESDSGAIDLN
jgi:hypothetical protein